MLSTLSTSQAAKRSCLRSHFPIEIFVNAQGDFLSHGMSIHPHVWMCHSRFLAPRERCALLSAAAIMIA
jgi:hypothetical protein